MGLGFCFCWTSNRSPTNLLRLRYCSPQEHKVDSRLSSGLRKTCRRHPHLPCFYPHFYEKVIKVKADVAALHIFFSDIDAAASGGVESCQGRRCWAFILTLDRSPRHFKIERRTKRN